MRSHLGALLFAAIVSTLAAGSLAAQDAGLEGRFVRDADASDPIDKIVDDGMSKLGRVYRVWPISGQSKKRLAETNQPYQWIRISTDNGSVLVQTDAFELTTPRNGTLENWERKKGDFIDVTTRMESRMLEQAFDAEDGRRVSVYTVSEDGSTLTLDVTVTSPKLDSPLVYRQVYRREG